MLVKDKVFVLKKTKYAEADLILQCLNSKGARVSLFARAALKSRKRFGGGVLEPTHYVSVLYQERSGSESHLHTLKEAALVEGFENLRTDYERLETALHMTRLVGDTAREGDVHSTALFNLLGNALRAAETSTALDRLRIHFDVKLLGQHGVLPPHDEETLLLGTPISEHAAVPLSDREWVNVDHRVQRVMREFLDQIPRV